ncbi:hypothetical protein [Dethiosulfovibrio salsuginis]|uniref:hypothetical protein n=1 Tax=Dethiosulfovibrio salsuginis TaxID=561720 RepID=UPI000A1CE165|nr:hypothetical protein [Dethiosulfovibrio salsuginis]
MNRKPIGLNAYDQREASVGWKGLWTLSFGIRPGELEPKGLWAGVGLPVDLRQRVGAGRFTSKQGGTAGI